MELRLVGAWVPQRAFWMVFRLAAHPIPERWMAQDSDQRWEGLCRLVRVIRKVPTTTMDSRRVSHCRLPLGHSQVWCQVEQRKRW